MKLVDRTGKRYGMLTVLRQAEDNDKHGHARWHCICDCGKETIVPSNHLTPGKTKSCGCQMGGRLPRNEGSFNSLLRNYKSSARLRGIKFRLTREEFQELTKSNCYYCGQPPAQSHRNNAIHYRFYVYNGIDRLDNDKGYSVENSVPCCGTCNKAKRQMSVEQFLAWIARVAEYQGMIQ